MSNYTSKSLSYDKEDKGGRQKLTHEFICKEYKNQHWIPPLALIAFFIVVFLTAVVFYLSWIYYDYFDGFFAILCKISVLIFASAFIVTAIYKIYIQHSTKNAIKNKEYTIITDNIASFEEKTSLAVVGHGSRTHIGFETKYYARMSRFGRIRVGDNFSEQHSVGNTFYIVVANKRPKKLVLWFNSYAYELDDVSK